MSLAMAPAYGVARRSSRVCVTTQKYRTTTDQPLCHSSHLWVTPYMRRFWRQRCDRFTFTILVAIALGTAAPAALPGRAAAEDTFKGVVRTLAADTVSPGTTTPVFTGRSQDVYRQVLVTPRRTYFLRGGRLRPNTRVRITGPPARAPLAGGAGATPGTAGGGAGAG